MTASAHMNIAMVSPEAEIGTGTVIEPGVVIGPYVRIGQNCRIKAGAVIGGDGFGFERDEDGRWRHRAHSCGVVIADDVWIGSNTCIDRGRVRYTFISNGVRIDNQCHIAHGAWIWEDVIVVAHAGLGGSCGVGAGAYIGFGAHLKQGVRIGERAMVGMGSVVLKDVPADVTVAGVPAVCIDAECGVRDDRT